MALKRFFFYLDLNLLTGPKPHWGNVNPHVNKHSVCCHLLMMDRPQWVTDSLPVQYHAAIWPFPP